MSSEYTVLVADDSMWARKTAVDCLQQTEFRVIGQATDGKEAVELFKRLTPDITILDLIMPERDGLESLKAIMEEAIPAILEKASKMGRD